MSKKEFHIELVYTYEEHTIVIGWKLTDCFSVSAFDKNGPTDFQIFSVRRSDVAAKFDMPDNELGFIITINQADTDSLSISFQTQENGIYKPINMDYALYIPDNYIKLLANQDIGRLGLAPTVEQQVLSYCELAEQPSANAFGYIEGSIAVPGRRGSWLYGWLTSDQLVTWSLETENGENIPIRSKNMYRFNRKDIFDHMPSFNHINKLCGFTAFVDEIKCGVNGRLNANYGAKRYSICNFSIQECSSDFKSNLQRIMHIDSPITEYAGRYDSSDRHILNMISEKRVEELDSYEIVDKRVGHIPDCPDVTIIIPLYGRYDFVEHQLIKFSQDKYVLEKCEILYIIDDERLVDGFDADIKHLFEFFSVPMRWAWGGTNRGFSSANNLGRKLANGKFLLFMNSDVFIDGPGQIERLKTVCELNDNFGVVAPRLIFADGGIQHAGMTSRWLPGLKIWINHHLHMGIDPEMDPSLDVTEVDMVTGACMMMRTTVFDDVAGWDDLYLIGDFEDSDLCLKLHQKGLSSVYDPTVTMTHLERQSFKDHGHDDFRQRVTIANAARHQLKWKSHFDSSFV